MTPPIDGGSLAGNVPSTASSTLRSLLLPFVCFSRYLLRITASMELMVGPGCPGFDWPPAAGPPMWNTAGHDASIGPI